VDQDSKKKAKRLARLAKRDAGLGQIQGEPILNKNKSKAKTWGKDKGKETENPDFEEVAAVSDYSNDDEAVAVRLAMGTKAIVKKQRQELMDSSYNRYAVDLDETRSLPQWFVHEERLHNTANLPVTRDEVNALKDRLRSINAKPIKKIAEAAARKKQRTERRWLKIKGQMDTVASTIGEDGSNAVSKIKAMEKLAAKKDKRQLRGDKKYIITRKSGGGITAKNRGGKRKGSGPTVAVDKRLKKDKKGARRASEKNKKQTKTSNKRKHNQ